MQTPQAWSDEYFRVGTEEKVWALGTLLRRVQEEAVAEMEAAYGVLPAGAAPLTPAENWVAEFALRGRNENCWLISGIVLDVQSEVVSRFKSIQEVSA